jgi:hypothetical protein
MSIYRKTEKISIQGSELDYVKPSLVQMPYVMQWMRVGLAPTFLTKEQLNSMTSMQVFEECISYVSDLNNSGISEDERNSIWGAALVTSGGTIDYLFPVIKTCFPEVELELVTDEALNEILTVFFSDYFASLQTK